MALRVNGTIKECGCRPRLAEQVKFKVRIELGLIQIIEAAEL
jgi:hypothetical protein